MVHKNVVHLALFYSNTWFRILKLIIKNYFFYNKMLKYLFLGQLQLTCWKFIWRILIDEIKFAMAMLARN